MAAINKYRTLGVQCCLCESSRGAFSQCRERGCQQHMHVTCARDSKLCVVVDGATVGNMKDNIESELFCPDHSDLNTDDLQVDSVPKHVLVHHAQGFPSEPIPFPRLSRAEQVEALSNPKYERDFLRELESVRPQTRCDVCDEDYGNIALRCSNCNAGLCECCPDLYDNASKGTKGDFLCAPCSHLASKSAAGGTCDVPQCTVCFSMGGWLRRASAQPDAVRQKKWEKNPKKFAETLFAKDIWCHTICAR